MKNVFSKLKVTKGIRMYATEDGKQRYFGEDTKYFISYNTWLNEDHYTICGASGSEFYSYAVLDLYGATLQSGYCKGEHIQIDKTDVMKYIVVSGFVSDLENLMILDAPDSEVGPNPKYIPCDDDHGGGGGGISSTLVAKDFEWDGDVTYTIHEFTDPFVDTWVELPDDFVVYIENAEHIVEHAQVSVFGHIFEIEHIDGNPIERKIENVPKVFPLLFSKSYMRAKTLYNFVATGTQTGIGLNDVFIDLDEEESPK